MKLFRIRPGSDDASTRRLRVVVTGATGYLGRAVVRELASAGHEVVGLTRWAERTLELKSLGARAVVGDLRDPASYRAAVRGYDAFVHLAAASGSARVPADAAAIDALLWAARPEEPARADEPPRVLVYTSGCFVLGPTGDAGADESASTGRAPDVVGWRPAHEQRVLSAGDERLATAVIRPGMVYGGTGGYISGFFASAEAEGAARVVGDGRNRWSPVHREDLARFYRLVLERRERGVFHCAEARAVPVGEIARRASEAAGRGGAVVATPLPEARAGLGPVADALAMDQVVLSIRAAQLGWRPGPPLLERVPSLYDEWRAGRGAFQPQDCT